MLFAVKQFWRQSPARQRYLALSARERRLAIACLTVSALAVGYLGLATLYESRQAALARYAAWQSDLAWMLANRDAAQAMRADGTAREQTRLSTINAVAKEFGVPLRRVLPEADGFSVQIDGQPFDSVIRWSYALQMRHGIEIAAASVDLRAPGVVDARFRLR